MVGVGPTTQVGPTSLSMCSPVAIYSPWSTALAAAKRAIGTRNGEQLT